MFARNTRIFLLLIAMTGMQLLSTVHALDHAIEHHDHNCALCLAAQENDHASLGLPATPFVSLPDHFSDFSVRTFYTPAFRASFFGRAPPFNSPT